MILAAYAVIFAGASAPIVARPQVVRTAQLQLQRESIIRVPNAAPQQRGRSLKWKEKGGPSCIAWSRLAAAMISSATTIDVVVRGGTRYRVKLERSCRSIDFYSGFYVKATRDGQVCEERDMIHARSGGACAIDKFKTLIAGK